MILLTFLAISFNANAGDTIKLTVNCFLEGYYQAGATMTPAAVNEGCPWAVTNLVDRVQVYLKNSTAPYATVATAIANLYTNGTTNQVVLTSSSLNKTKKYFLVIKNSRHHLETWSGAAKVFLPVDVYNFTTDPASAYSSNMKKVEGTTTGYPLGVWAFYAGNVNHDNCITDADYNLIEDDVNNFVTGCVETDINGDGNVDILDLPIVEANVNAAICVKKP